MNIIVFGANGGVGRHLVQQALEAGHDVTAALRSPERLALSHRRLRRVACDVRDADAVAAAMAGQQAVCCTLGDPSRGPTTLYSDAARSVATAMTATGTRRLVFLSNFGVLGETATDLRGRFLLFALRRVVRHTLLDHRRALDHLRLQPIDWVAVRPMALTNGPLTGGYRISPDRLPAGGWRVSRADVAHFMLAQATGSVPHGRSPALAM